MDGFNHLGCVGVQAADGEVGDGRDLAEGIRQTVILDQTGCRVRPAFCHTFSSMVQHSPVGGETAVRHKEDFPPGLVRRSFSPSVKRIRRVSVSAHETGRVEPRCQDAVIAEIYLRYVLFCESCAQGGRRSQREV